MKKFLCLLALCSLFLCSCGQEKVAVNADFGGTLSLFAFEEDTINPLKSKYQTNAQVFSAVMHKGLVKVAQNLEIECDLAEKYEFSADKMQIKFTLSDALFSDGSKVSAEDVIKSLDTLKQNSQSMYSVIFEFVSDYSANGNTVTFNLKRPDSGALYYMDFPVVKDDGNVIGAGHYKLSEIQTDRVIFSATDSLKTNFETVKIMMYPKEDMAENSFLANEIDIINADYLNLARLQSKTETVSFEYVSDNFTFLGINTQNDILKDVNVRRAIASSIDKKELASTLMAGCAVPVNSPFKPETVYGGLYSGEYAKDYEMTEKYLDKSELKPEDMILKILINEDSITKEKVAQYISKNLTDAGISASVEKVPFETYSQRIVNGEYTLFVGETTVSKNQDFEFLVEMTGEKTEESANLFTNFRNETNIEKKAENAKNIAKYFVDNLPVISLYYQKNTLISDADIEGEFKPMQTNLFGGIDGFKYKK